MITIDNVPESVEEQTPFKKTEKRLFSQKGSQVLLMSATQESIEQQI